MARNILLLLSTIFALVSLMYLYVGLNEIQSNIDRLDFATSNVIHKDNSNLAGIATTNATTDRLLFNADVVYQEPDFTEFAQITLKLYDKERLYEEPLLYNIINNGVKESVYFLGNRSVPIPIEEVLEIKETFDQNKNASIHESVLVYPEESGPFISYMNVTVSE